MGKNQNTDKTHCLRGHEFSGENLIFKNGFRICRKCRNTDSNRRGQIKRREEDRLSPERRAHLSRRRRRSQLKKVGWTPELFEARLVEQKNLCAICKRVLNQEKNHNDLVARADHEHAIIPKPRGVLCGNCNLGIGNLQENPEIMQAAIAYIEKWKEG